MGFITLTKSVSPMPGEPIITPGFRVQINRIDGYWPRLARDGKVLGTAILMSGLVLDVTQTPEEIDKQIRVVRGMP